MKGKVNKQSWVGYRVSFGTRGIVLWKSRNGMILQNDAGVCNTEGKYNGSVGREEATYICVYQ
jgi:hypothetical protein